MAYNPTNPVTVGAATKADHYARVFDNTVALRAGEIAIASQAALDFIYGSSATQLARLAAGAALQVPRINAAGNAWEFGTIVGVSFLTKSANYTILTTDGLDLVVLVDAAANNVTITLPDAGASSQRITIVRTDTSSSFTVTVTPAAGDTIKGEASIGLYVRSDFVSIYPRTSADWTIVADKVTIVAVAARSGAQTGVSTGTLTKVQLNSEVADSAGAFDSATNYRFTAPRAGLYVVFAQIAFTSPGASRCQAHIYKNGSSYRFAWSEQMGTVDSTLSTLANMRLARGDTIELYGLHNKGSNDGFDSGTTLLDIALVGN